MKLSSQATALFTAMRPNQWIKNLSVFASIIFTGQLFNPQYFFASLAGFFVFNALSSSSYLLNDIIDLPYDKVHQEKRKRPLASGKLSLNTAMEAMMVLSLLGLIAAFFLGTSFFFVTAAFFLLHIFYSLFLKKIAVLDILGIATSFFLRVFAGEVLNGFHLSIWLSLTVVFLSLFIASCKRRSELELEGDRARPSLAQYRMRLIDFYTSTFATATIIAYSLFSFLENSPTFGGPLGSIVSFLFPQAVGRKLFILTFPFILYGIMRYAQLIYEKPVGEKPEALVTQDRPLVIDILIWGVLVIAIVYGL